MEAEAEEIAEEEEVAEEIAEQQKEELADDRTAGPPQPQPEQQRPSGAEAESSAPSSNACYQCGLPGHFARDCPSRSEPPPVLCPCGGGVCVVLTAGTEKNKGRRFYRCPKPRGADSCDYFQWTDEAPRQPAAGRPVAGAPPAGAPPAGVASSSSARMCDDMDDAAFLAMDLPQANPAVSANPPPPPAAVYPSPPAAAAYSPAAAAAYSSQGWPPRAPSQGPPQAAAESEREARLQRARQQQEQMRARLAAKQPAPPPYAQPYAAQSPTAPQAQNLCFRCQ